MRSIQKFGTVVAVFFAGACVVAASAGAESADKPHAVIVVGTTHYSPQNSMPLLAQELERHGFRTTVILPQGDPEQNKNGVGLPGLEALSSADIAVFFVRFLELPDDQFKQIMDYVKSGRPVVGLRTSTHAFLYPDEHPHFRWNNDFGRYVLGTRYVAHLSGETECRVVERHKDHAVLTGAASDPFRSMGSLYLTSLQPGCEPLVLGAGRGRADRLVENQFGTYYLNEIDTDIVAWTWRNQWDGRVFCTSFGHVGDFAVESIMRILVNGVCWAADHPVPSANATINTYQVQDAEAQAKSKRPKKSGR